MSVDKWLAEGEAILGTSGTLSYSWSWLRHGQDDRIATTRCFAPAPDGVAYYCHIALHPDRMAAVSEEERRTTVLHELAHVVDFAGHPDLDAEHHGPAWLAIMARMGVDASLTVSP